MLKRTQGGAQYLESGELVFSAGFTSSRPICASYLIFQDKKRPASWDVVMIQLVQVKVFHDP